MSEPKRPHLILIDGPAGAGKTTLAQKLSQVEPESLVIHLDDLYAGWDDPLEAQFEERVLTQVIRPWFAQATIEFQKFDWLNGVFGEWLKLPYQRVLIIEGVGAGSRAFREHASALYFLEVPAELARERVIARDGEFVIPHLDAWQDKESRHFEEHETRAAATLTLPATRD